MTIYFFMRHISSFINHKYLGILPKRAFIVIISMQMRGKGLFPKQNPNVKL